MAREKGPTFTANEWSKQLRRNKYDLEWFRHYREPLCIALERGLKSIRKRQDFGKVMVYALPFLPTDRVQNFWEPVVQLALDVEPTFDDTFVRSRMLNQLGSYFIANNRIDEAKEVYNRAYEIATSAEDHVNELESLIGLLNVEQQGHIERFNYEMIPDLLAYHAEIRTPEQTAQLHLAIAKFLNQTSRYEEAVPFATASYAYWKDTSNVLEFGRSAYILSQSYRNLQNNSYADHLLEQAAQSYSTTEYIWQYAAIAHEYACSAYYEGRYEEAAQWIQKAWEEVRLMEDPLRQERVLHSFGMILSMLKNRMGMARVYLNQALDLAHELGNDADIAHILHTLAFNSARRGENEQALEEIEQAIQRAQLVSDERHRQTLVQDMEEFRTWVTNNDPRLAP
jgi:tetratricopeptide (TPR) repeat protein